MSEQAGIDNGRRKRPIARVRDLAEVRKPKAVEQAQEKASVVELEIAKTALLHPKDPEYVAWGDPDPSLAYVPRILPPSPEAVENGKNEQLGIVTFKDTESGFELTMTDSFYDRVKDKYGGANRMRQVFMDMRAAVLQDPFGEHSIDEFVDTDAGRWARVVQKLPDDSPLADLVPEKQLAVKTTGMDMEVTRKYLEFRTGRRSKLTDQFRATRELIELQKKVAPNGFADGRIGVADAYAVLREPWQEGDYEHREWMLMEYIPDAKPVSEVMFALIGGGVSPGFETDKYPELAEVIQKSESFRYPEDSYEFSDLADALSGAKQYGMPSNGAESYLSDLRGQNMLVTAGPDGKKQYTIIDVQRSSREW